MKLNGPLGHVFGPRSFQPGGKGLNFISEAFERIRKPIDHNYYVMEYEASVSFYVLNEHLTEVLKLINESANPSIGHHGLLRKYRYFKTTCSAYGVGDISRGSGAIWTQIRASCIL